MLKVALGLALVLVLLTVPAFGDIILQPYTITSSNGLYQASILDPTIYAPQFLLILGPSGVAAYVSTNGPFTSGPPGQDFMINNYGQVVGYTDGGTSDPTIWYAEYYGDAFRTFVGSAPFVQSLGGSNSLQTSGTIATIYGPGGIGYPHLVGLSDSGLVTIDYSLVDGWSSHFIEAVQLPNSQVPEPAAVLLLATVLAFVYVRHKLRSTPSTKAEIR
jgi:hypothetical protein